MFQIINKWGLISKTEIQNIMKMAQRNDSSVNVGNYIPMREDGRKKRYQTSKYKIRNKGA